jgi:signal transduction histidine kinase
LNLLDALPYAVYEARPSGDVLSMSARVEDLLGIPAARFTSEPGLLARIVHPDDRARRQQALGALGSVGQHAWIEYRLLHANGIDIAYVADHVQVREANVLVGMLVDLTQRKLSEQTAREHARLASLGELAAGVAHEVNNPLSGVLNYAQLAKRLLQQPGPFSTAKLVEPLEGVIAEGERILEITKTLVSFARRPEQEAYRALSVAELVRATLTISKQRLKEHSIAIDVEIPQDLPAVRARGHELTQVLQHLIANAHLALNARFPRWDPQKRLAFRAARIDGDSAHPSGYVRIEVADKGAGIAPENLPRVFVPFFTTRKDGSGLGLTCTREIVQAHGGKVTITSAPNEGTTVAFTIPAF